MGTNIQMTEKESLPQEEKTSPCGVILQDWEIETLGRICNDIRSGNNKTKCTDGKYPVYGSTGIIGYTNQYVYDKPLLLIARVGANAGTVNKVYGKCDVSDNTIIIDVKSNVHFLFLYNLLSASHLSKFVFGSGQPLITSGTLKSMRILVPPVEEQQKIAEILSEWDKAIELQTKLIERLELRKRALMQRLLTGRVRLKGFSGKWKKIKLGNCCERVIRRNSSINKNVMTISAQKGFVTQTDFFNKTIASEVLDNYYLVHKDEFCYNKSYSNGYPMGAIKRLKEANEAVVTTLYICFRLKENADINIEFFEQYCEFGGLNRELVKVANEGGRAHGLLNVTPTDFFNIKFAVPSVLEQEAIANRLIAADKEIEFEKQKLSLLLKQKRGLMQQLLTGKKRVI